MGRKKPGRKSEPEPDKKSHPWRPTARQVLWAIGMVVALATFAYLFTYWYFSAVWLDPRSAPSVEASDLALVGAALALMTVIVLLIAGGVSYGWTGFGGKTLWDWLQLLIVPLVLAAGGLWFTFQLDQRQQVTEDNRAMDTALQAYLDQMSRLLIEEDLHNAQPGDSLSDLARARTLTILDQLDGDRRERVLQFLYEADLIDKEHPVFTLEDANLSDVSINEDYSGANLAGVFLGESDLSSITLDEADLSDADLRNAYLSSAELKGTDLSSATLLYTDLSSTNLTGADLSDATLAYARLSGANLDSADLSDAHLYDTDLSYAHLPGADLSDVYLTDGPEQGADFSYADLTNADLSDAYLYGADLSDANLTGADLTNAEITQEQLDQANTLEGATMPNGQKYEDWLKSREGEGG